MKKLSVLSLAVSVIALGAQAFGQVSIDFESDPGLTVTGNAELRADGGNPGGYLSVTDAANAQRGAIIFPDLTGGSPVTLLNIKADLRVGGGTDRPADGFSFNLVRPGDPLLQDPVGEGYAASPAGEANLPEEGSTTGLGIGFDEWQSGPADPNATATDCGATTFDCVGMSVRIDNELIAQVALPTLNGALDDLTSLQTGDRGPDGPGDISALGWAEFEIDLQPDKTLTINYKGNTVFSDTIAIEPFAGQLVFGGRTGGANAAHHIDNIAITIPEPGTLALAVTGVGFMLLRLRRRRS